MQAIGAGHETTLEDKSLPPAVTRLCAVLLVRLLSRYLGPLAQRACDTDMSSLVTGTLACGLYIVKGNAVCIFICTCTCNLG